MIFLITYDLKTPNDTSTDYTRVINAIKEFYPAWCHLEKSVWLVSTTSDAVTIRERLKPYLYGKDAIFVAKLSGNWAGRNLDPAQGDWLKGEPF